MTAAETQTLLQAATAQAAAAVKVARDLQTKVAAAPAGVTADTVEKAAAALVAGGWIAEAQKDQAKAALADPEAAVLTLYNLAVKAAAVRDGGTDPRLKTGDPVSAGGVKYASNGRPLESEADAWWTERQSQYRKI